MPNWNKNYMSESLPERINLMCMKAAESKINGNSKIKCLVDANWTIDQLAHYLQNKRLKITYPEEFLFFDDNRNYIPGQTPLLELYFTLKDQNGMLQLTWLDGSSKQAGKGMFAPLSK